MREHAKSGKKLKLGDDIQEKGEVAGQQRIENTLLIQRGCCDTREREREREREKRERENFEEMFARGVNG